MIFLAVLNLLFINGLNGINFAIDSNVDCEGKLLSPKITDGNRETSVFYKSVVCDYIMVDLDQPYTLHYVIVIQSPLPSYRVSLIADHRMGKATTGAYSCGLYYSFEEPRDRNETTFQRTNCEMFAIYFETIKITNTVVKQHVFAEIEAHGIEISKTKAKSMIYRGCYTLVNSKPGVKLMDKNLNTCYEQCIGYGFAAIQGTTCLCVNEFVDKDETLMTQCYYICQGYSDRYCGGKTAYSLYLINLQLPYYKGCYKDKESECKQSSCKFEAIPRDVELTYLYICMLRCNGSRYLNLKDEYCWCESKLYTEVADSSCSIKCSDGTQCGSKDHFSVYGTCYTEWTHVQCSLLLRCENGFDNFGTCDIAGCQEGWRGDYCVERDMESVTFEFTVKLTTTTTTTQSITTTHQMLTNLDSATIATKPYIATTVKEGNNDEENVIPTMLTTEKYKGLTYEHFCKANSCDHMPDSRCVNSRTGFTCQCIQGFKEKDAKCQADETLLAATNSEEDSVYALWIFYGICLVLILGLVGVYCYDTRFGEEMSQESE